MKEKITHRRYKILKLTGAKRLDAERMGWGFQEEKRYVLKG